MHCKPLILVLPCAAILLAPLAAQTSKPASKPAVVPEDQAPGPTKEQRIKVLQDTLAKLKKEKATFDRVHKEGGLAKLLLQKIRYRNLKGIPQANQPVGPMLPKRLQARLLGDTERKNLAEGVVLTIDGQPVTQTEFDGLFDYLRSYPRPWTDEQVRVMVIHSFMEAKVPQAAFPKTTKAAHTQALKVLAELKAGGSFADLAKKYSHDKATADKGGNVGFVGREDWNKLVARDLFTLGLGKLSGVLQSAEGFHIVQITGRKKGDTPDKDRVRVRHILIRYNPDVAKVKATLNKIKSVQVDLAFRDKDLKKFAPESYRSNTGN